jgi:hypothetical protein
MRGHLVAALAALTLVVAVPAVAQADVYCVNEPSCVSAGGHNEGSEGVALQNALNSASTHKTAVAPTAW